MISVVNTGNGNSLCISCHAALSINNNNNNNNSQIYIAPYAELVSMLLSVETHALVDLVGTLESTCSTRLMTNFVSNLSLRFSIMNVFDFLLLMSIAPKFMSLIGEMLYLLHTEAFYYYYY